MWRVHDGMGWWMVFGGLLWLAFWVFVVYLVVTLVTNRSTTQHDSGAAARPESAVEIARRRYAAGEITREQFEQIRNDLERPRESQPH